jgi:hypothetical protein
MLSPVKSTAKPKETKGAKTNAPSSDAVEAMREAPEEGGGK